MAQPGRRGMIIKRPLFTSALALFSLSSLAIGDLSVDELMEMSFDELLEVKIVSLNKTESRWFTSAAAVYVINREEIQASSAENIPDLLANVPGIFATQNRANFDTISVRADTRTFSTTALVLIDGVPVYSPVTGGPTFSGINISLDDIEHIEIIRGSGGTNWGTNSSAGIINIITRNAASVEGGFTRLSANTNPRYEGVLQYGAGRDGKHTYVTLSTEKDHGFDHEEGLNEDYQKHLMRLRNDSRLGNWQTSTSLSISGYSREEESIFDHALDSHQSKAPNNYNYFAMSEARYAFRSGNTFTVKPSLYRQSINDNLAPTKYKLTQWDLETRYHHTWNSQHKTQLSTDLRRNRVDTRAKLPPSLFRYTPNTDNRDLFAVGLHQIYTPDTAWIFELGVRSEKFSYIDSWHFSPTVRLSYSPDNRRSIWAAVTRSYQSPSFIQNTADRFTGTIDTATGLPIRNVGNSDLRAEEYLDYQLGVRQQWKRHLFDITVYHQNINDTILIDPLTPLAVTNQQVIRTRRNIGDSENYGVEAVWTYQPNPEYRSQVNFTYQDNTLRHVDRSSLKAVSQSPDYKISWINQLELSAKLSLWASLTWYDDYNTSTGNDFFPTDSMQVENHYRLDANLKYLAMPDLDLNLGVKNVFNNEEESFSTFAVSHPEQVEPSVIFRLDYRFKKQQ